MRTSLWSLGFVMVVLGGGSLLLGREHGVVPTASAAIATGALTLGGAALLLRRDWGYWVALGSTVLLAGMSGVGMMLKRPIGLPLPPLISLAAGLYLTLRLLLARGALKPRPTPDESDA